MKRVVLFGTFNKIYENSVFEAEDPTIKAIQAALKAKGPEYAALLGTSGPNGDGVDGQTGPKTTAAIKKFQTDNGISPTGFVGKQTAPKLGVSPMTSTKTATTPTNKPVNQPVPHKGVSKNVPELEPDAPKTPGKLDFTPKPQTATVDTFSPYAKNATAEPLKAKYENFLKGTVSTLQNALGIPPHIRAFINYLRGRTAAYTTADFTKEELKTLLAMIGLAKKQGKPINGPVDFYQSANKLNTGGEAVKWGQENFGLSQLNLKELPTKLAMTLGNATVRETPTGYTITDTYDFNNYQNNPEKYTLAEIPSTVTNAVKLMAKGNFVQGVEQIASYKQKLGYKGYPIDLVIPKNLKV